MTVDWAIVGNFFLALAFLIFGRARLLTYLHFFQQDEYDGARFLSWVVAKRAFDRRASLFLGVVSIVVYFSIESGGLFAGTAFFVLLRLSQFAYVEPNPKKDGKKKLAMTARAKRIFHTALTLSTLLALGLIILRAPMPLWILAIQLLPLILVISNLLLQPYESMQQQRFWKEAHEKLVKLQPTIIGITGSFGKTSVKHILGHLLESQASSLMTPGSVNTPMGIARIVREQLGPQHRFFICEMGAYGPGSVARLCRLAPPDIAVITAIGAAHYERFRSLETVAQAKFELAEAAAARKGKIIVAADVLRYPAASGFYESHRDNVIVVGEETAALQISDMRQEKKGIAFKGSWQGKTYQFRAPLFGLHHCRNVALSFATACTIGVRPEDVITALSTLPQIKHRLEVTRAPEGWTLVDDAYNSNPVGFAAALQLLDTLKEKGGRRILITPGMVELGAAHDEEHAKIGTLAAQHVEVLLPIMPERIATLVEKFRFKAPNAIVIPCKTFAEAQKWLTENATAKDVVLIENDLPDIYEANLHFL